MHFCKFFVFAATLMGASAWALDPPPPARIISARGEVFVNGHAVKEGAIAQNGQIIETKLGKCTAVFGGQHVLHLDTDSQIKVNVTESGEQVTLDLPHGKTRALIHNAPTKKNNFQIRTRAAVMGVRGTHIYVDQPRGADSAPRFMTVEGQAELTLAAPAAKARGAAAPSQPVLINANQSVDLGNTSPTGAPRVTTLAKGDVKEMVNAVAPPPLPMRTEGEVQRYADRMVTIADIKRDRPMIPLLPFAPPPQLDPVADKFTGIIVTGTIQK